MRYYLTSAETSVIATNLLENIIRTCGLMQQYKLRPDIISQHLTIGKLIELVNSHINKSFHIENINFNRSGKWMIETATYTVSDMELVVALWKAVRWCYDDVDRIKKKKEEEDKWKEKDDEKLVNERYIS